MISLAPGTKVYLASKPVSMRLGFDGLAALVRPLFAVEPYGGHVFPFRRALLRKSGPRQQLTFEGIQLRDTLSLRPSERGEAVEDGRTDLDFSDLAIEVSSHDAFPQQLETMHFRLDQTALVIAAPSLPDRSPEPPA